MVGWAPLRQVEAAEQRPYTERRQRRPRDAVAGQSLGSESAGVVGEIDGAAAVEDANRGE
jgi:hypothetical protein